MNILLVEEVKKSPSYVKCLKEVVSRKRKLVELEYNLSMYMSYHPSLRIQGVFSISCTIESISFENILCDLVACLNVMYFSTSQLVKLTKMVNKLADRSTRTPLGVVENVQVKVGNYIFLMDFVVL